jgi:hypothetical protein
MNSIVFKSRANGTGAWFRIALMIVCYCLVTSHGVAQADSVKFNPDSSQSISISAFDSLVSNSIALLKTRNLFDILDLGHINIMMCYNTIKFTRTNPGFEFRWPTTNIRNLKAYSLEKIT